MQGASCRGDNHGVGTIAVWGAPCRGDHHGVGTIAMWGPSQCGDHHSVETTMVQGPLQCGDHHSVGTITVQGPSQYGGHHGMGTIMSWGPSRHREHRDPGATLRQCWRCRGVRGNAKAGWEETEAGNEWGGGGEADKIAAASQAALGELSKASPGPRPPKAPPAPRSSASVSHGAVSVNKRLIIQETLEQDDEIFLLLRSPRASGQTSQAWDSKRMS